MTAAVVTLALVALGLAAGLVWAVRSAIAAKDESATIGDLYRETVKLRDQQAVEIASLKQQLATAKTLAAIAQKQRNDASAAKTAATVKKIKEAPTAKDAAKVVNEALPIDIRTGGPIEELK